MPNPTIESNKDLCQMDFYGNFFSFERSETDNLLLCVREFNFGRLNLEQIS